MQRTISGVSRENTLAGPSLITSDNEAIQQNRQRAEMTGVNNASAERTTAPSSEAAKAAMLSQAVDFANTTAAQFNTTLSFNFDERIGQVVVSIKAGNTDKVIRQIPPEHMVELAATFKSQLRGLILNHQG